MASVLITGASKGIGFESALTLAAEHHVLALARSADGLAELQAAATTCAAAVRLHTLSFDIVSGDYEGILLPFIRKNLGQVNVLINNAGTLINKPFLETTSAEFSAMFQSNFLGHVSMIQHLLPLMPPGSHIVNIGSMGGFQGSVKFPGLAAYSASKAALHTLTECIALEFSDKDIKINCLALGSAQTEMLEKAFPQYKSPVSAAEMGEFIAHFALTGHRFFNGKIIPVTVTTP